MAKNKTTAPTAPAASRKDKALAAAHEWWEFTAAMVRHLADTAAAVQSEMKRANSPLADVFNPDSLGELVNILDDASGKAAVCFPQPVLKDVDVPDPLAWKD